MPLSDEHKKRAGRNYTLAGVLLAFVVLFFLLTLAKLNVI